MRSVWATSSAALFFLAETEAYFQGEVVQSTWAGFKKWIMSEKEPQNSTRSRLGPTEIGFKGYSSDVEVGAASQSNYNQSYDPQSMTYAHQRYLSALATSLLLTIPAFTNSLYHLLQQIDYLVAIVHRIHSIWQSLDLEDDKGVVDAYSNFHNEEVDVKAQLHTAAVKVKMAIENLVHDLREIDQQKDSRDDGFAELVLHEEGTYVPAKVGRLNRLLMKLDFGGWFDGHKSDHPIDDLLSDEE